MAWYVSSAIEALTEHRERTALSYRGRTVRYGELLDDVYRKAHALRRNGLRRGDGLVRVCGNQPVAFSVRLAAFLLGLRFTPLVPGLTDPRYVVADSGAAAVVAEEPLDVDVPVLTLDDFTGPADPLPVDAREEDV